MKKIISYNLIIVTILIVFFEFFLRTFSSINELGYEKNLFNTESEIVVHNPNVDSVVFGNKVFIDKYGFRVPKKNYQYPISSKSSFLLLGDSVSFGVGVDEDQTFVGLIRKSFNNINFFNASVSGHNSLDHLKLLKKYIKTLEFNNVIIFYCLNDIVNMPGVITKKEKYKSNYFLSKINIFLRNKSYIYIFLKSKFINPEKRYYDYIISYYEDKKTIKNMTNIFQEIKEFSINNKIKLTVIVLPYKYQIKKNCLNTLLSPQSVMKEIFIINEIEHYDFTNNFCDLAKDNLFLKYDPVHLSKYGHSTVFNFLKNKINFEIFNEKYN